LSRIRASAKPTPSPISSEGIGWRRIKSVRFPARSFTEASWRQVVFDSVVHLLEQHLLLLERGMQLCLQPPALAQVEGKSYALLGGVLQPSHAEQHRHPTPLFAQVLFLEGGAYTAGLELCLGMCIQMTVFGWGHHIPL
jgi:hypothetical protein